MLVFVASFYNGFYCDVVGATLVVGCWEKSLWVLCCGTSGTTFPTVGAASFIENAVGAHLCVRPLLMGQGYNPSVLPSGLPVVPHPSFPYGNATFPSGKAFPYFRLLWNGGFYWKRCRGAPMCAPVFSGTGLHSIGFALRVIGYPSSVISLRKCHLPLREGFSIFPPFVERRGLLETL